MLRHTTSTDFPAILAIINDAALAYKGVIPADRWHEPYMAEDKLAAEIADGVQFWGWEADGELAGVMGLQRVRDVHLIRHAYVKSAHQGKGIGGQLLAALSQRVTGTLLVGTWADADWAVRFYERNGFALTDKAEKERLLTTYWNIPARQVETSVVLVKAA